MKKLILSFVLLACLAFIAHPAFAKDAADDMAVNATTAGEPTYAADEGPFTDGPAPVAKPAIVQSTVTAEPKAAAVSEPQPVVAAPAEDKPHIVVDASYKIIPGDVLQIDVWKEEGLNQEVLVLPDGMITFPLVGSFSVASMTPEDVQTTIKQKLKKYIPDATVTVSVKAALGHTVSVIGQVTKPGEFVMSHGLTVMQALSQAGGLTPYADEGDVIVLRRANGIETSIAVPYRDIARGENLDKDIVLNPGDVVVVPTTSLF